MQSRFHKDYHDKTPFSWFSLANTMVSNTFNTVMIKALTPTDLVIWGSQRFKLTECVAVCRDAGSGRVRRRVRALPHHLDLDRSQAPIGIFFVLRPGTSNITGLSSLPACIFAGHPHHSPSSMPSRPVPPDTSRRKPVERGSEPFSPAEEKVLRDFLEDFRTKNKEERKNLLMYKIYRLIKAAGPQLTPEQWRIRKKV